MKGIISILLLLVTALYVLPVNNGFTADTETSCKYVDKTADDVKDNKKENGKEFIPAGLILDVSKDPKASTVFLFLPPGKPVHFTIETPPPDKA